MTKDELALVWGNLRGMETQQERLQAMGRRLRGESWSTIFPPAERTDGPYQPVGEALAKRHMKRAAGR